MRWQQDLSALGTPSGIKIMVEPVVTRDAVPSVGEGLAYANGYAAGLDDCDRADVADLINKLDVEIVRHSFTKALLRIAEENHAIAAGQLVGMQEERATAILAAEKRGYDRAVDEAVNRFKIARFAGVDDTTVVASILALKEFWLNEAASFTKEEVERAILALKTKDQ